MNRKTRLGIGVDLLLIDGMNVIMRCYHTMRGLFTENGDDTGIIYGFLKSLSATSRRYLPSGIIVVWEGHDSNAYRRDIYDGYKAKRKEKAVDINWDSIHHQIDVLHDFTSELGVGWLKIDGYEGDDVIASLTYAYPDKKIVINTSDRDLLQLITPNITWYSSGTFGQPKTIGYDDFYGKTGVTIKNYIDYKILVGDSSDGIPGIMGIGEKTAKGLLNQISLEEYLEQGVPNFPRTKNLFAPNAEEILNRNRKLMDLGLNCIERSQILDCMESSRLDECNMMDMLEDYSCWSILDSMDDFMVGFRNMGLEGVLNE